MGKIKSSKKQPTDDNVYKVERIIQKRTRRGKKEYLVKWENYEL